MIDVAPAFRQDYRLIAESTQIMAPNEYSLMGQRRVLPAQQDPTASPEVHSPPVVSALQNEIYVRFYCRPRRGDAPIISRQAVRDHVNALSSANCGRGSWEP